MSLVDTKDFTGEVKDIKIIDEKNVVYCSNFDININEWFNEYENIEIFKMNMKKNLGATCLSQFSLSLEIQSSKTPQEKGDLFFNQILNFYLSNYYSNALTACFKSENQSEKVNLSFLSNTYLQMFQNFYRDILEFLKEKQYIIVDLSNLQSLIHSFYIFSLQEYQNIMKKIESDQIQLTEKSLA